MESSTTCQSSITNVPYCEASKWQFFPFTNFGSIAKFWALAPPDLIPDDDSDLFGWASFSTHGDYKDKPLYMPCDILSSKTPNSLYFQLLISDCCNTVDLFSDVRWPFYILYKYHFQSKTNYMSYNAPMSLAILRNHSYRPCNLHITMMNISLSSHFYIYGT